MKSNIIEVYSTIDLNSEELSIINGGLNQEAYNSGYAVGAYIRKVADGVGFIALIALCL